jgi:hypothetical protein
MRGRENVSGEDASKPLTLPCTLYLVGVGIRWRWIMWASMVPLKDFDWARRELATEFGSLNKSTRTSRHALSPGLTMASAIFFLDLKGKTLLARNYRGDIPMSAVEKFMPLLLDAEEDNAAPPPCISHERVNV